MAKFNNSGSRRLFNSLRGVGVHSDLLMWRNVLLTVSFLLFLFFLGDSLDMWLKMILLDFWIFGFSILFLKWFFQFRLMQNSGVFLALWMLDLTGKSMATDSQERVSDSWLD
ncbi:hypothetical protein RhiirC2_709381 [Rhizophagus irregularis]|uniref:Transmembrane protein n=1 Tax=Rhizophagus irregularis TaxID=588596 RepID=A0A2N1NIR7_9GLOM|nr:hypothetical protein RhiirC2_709381 [Rhizophagus irregularis]